jgi:hypothetical protein
VSARACLDALYCGAKVPVDDGTRCPVCGLLVAKGAADAEHAIALDIAELPRSFVAQCRQLTHDAAGECLVQLCIATLAC